MCIETLSLHTHLLYTLPHGVLCLFNNEQNDFLSLLRVASKHYLGKMAPKELSQSNLLAGPSLGAWGWQAGEAWGCRELGQPVDEEQSQQFDGLLFSFLCVFVCVCVCGSVYMSIHTSVWLSGCLCLSDYLFVCQFMCCVSIYFITVFQLY